MPHLTSCLEDSGDLVFYLDKTFKDMKEGVAEGIGDILIDLGKLVKESPKAYQ